MSFTQKDLDLLERFNIGDEYHEERTLLRDLIVRVKELVPMPTKFDPFKVDMKGVGEVIERSDPRHPKYAVPPDAPDSTPAPQEGLSQSGG
jgi:hypothetical protein